MKHTIKKAVCLAFTAAACALLSPVSAQIPPPPTPTAPPTPTVPPTQVPLDGGVLLLAAAGAAYGAKKVYGKRKRSKV